MRKVNMEGKCHSMKRLQSDLKVLFYEWLKEAADNAFKRSTKAAMFYSKAFYNVRQYPHSIEDIRTLRLIPYVGEKTVKYLCERLQGYCQTNEYEYPSGFVVTSPEENQTSKKHSGTPNSELGAPSKKRQRKERRYVPKQRSGSYAILLALYLVDKRRRGMNKDEIIHHATPFADKSFKANPGTKEFYSAWNSIKILLNRDLICCTGRAPRFYYLTDEGFELSEQLKQAEGLTSSPKSSQELDLSFDNQVRVSPAYSSIRNWDELCSSPMPSEGNLFVRSDAEDSTRNAEDFEAISSPLGPRDTHKKLCSNISSFQPATPSVTRKDTNKMTETSSENANHDVSNKVLNNVRYDIWTADEYEIILIIDNREIRSQHERDFFQNKLTSLNVKCDVRPLSIGDFVWIAKSRRTGREAVLNCICERKRLDDLISSIKDGRFKEQKSRLRKTGMKHCYYIIEETPLYKVGNSGDMTEAVRTSIAATITLSFFYLRKFKNIEETIAFVASNTQVLINQLQSDRTSLIILKPKSIKNQMEYNHLIKDFQSEFETRKTKYECVHLFASFQDAMGKTGLMTVREMFIMMLMSIKGLSLERAMTIQNHFKTPRNLLHYFHSECRFLPETEKKSLMLDLFQHEVGNKKIGKVPLERVYDIWGC